MLRCAENGTEQGARNENGAGARVGVETAQEREKRALSRIRVVRDAGASGAAMTHS